MTVLTEPVSATVLKGNGGGRGREGGREAGRLLAFSKQTHFQEEAAAETRESRRRRIVKSKSEGRKIISPARRPEKGDNGPKELWQQ